MDASLSNIAEAPVKRKAISLKAALILVIVFNFMWAFSHTLLDVLNKHFQDKFHISHGESCVVKVRMIFHYS